MNLLHLRPRLRFLQSPVAVLMRAWSIRRHERRRPLHVRDRAGQHTASRAGTYC